MKIDWKKLNDFRSMSREEMEGLLREVRKKRIRPYLLQRIRQIRQSKAEKEFRKV